MLASDDPCRSPRVHGLDPEASPQVAVPPPVPRKLALPPMVLRVLPLCGSSAPIGYIYDATPLPDGGLLAAALAFFSHQGHQVAHDPCPNLSVYRSTLDLMASIISVDRLPDHILSSGLKLMEGLVAPSPVDVLATSFMSAYLSPSALNPPAPSVNMGGLQARSSQMGGLLPLAPLVNMGGIHETVGPPPGGRSVCSVNPAPSLATPAPALPFSLPASSDRSLQSAPGGFLHRSTLAPMGAFPPPPASAGPDLQVDLFPTPVSPASCHPDPDEELSPPPRPRHAVTAHRHGRLPSSSSSSSPIQESL